MISEYASQNESQVETGNHNVEKPGVRIRILTLLAAAIVILIVSSGITLYFTAKSRIAVESAEQFNRVPLAWQEQITEDADRINAMMDVLVSENHFHKALANRDAESLLRQTRPLYEHLRREHKITHFYFIDPDRVCLLRLHQPKRHGDRIDRFTAIEAENTGKTSWGVELGPMGTLTLRVVRPLYEGDRLIGYLELGEEIGHLIRRLKDSMGLDFYVAIDKQFLNHEDWQAGMQMLGRATDWDEFPTHVVVNQTRKSIPDFLLSCLAKDESAYNENIISSYAFGDSRYQVNIDKIEDAGGRKVGELIAMRDIKVEYQSLTKTFLMATLVCSAIGGVLFAFFYVFLGKVDRQLARQSEGLSKSNESLQSQIAECKRVEEALQCNERKLSKITNAALDAVIMMDPDGSIAHWNPAAEAIFGYSSEEVLGKSVHEMLAASQYREAAMKGHLQFTASGHGAAIGKTLELVALRKDGEEFPVELSLNSIEQDDGWWAVAVLRDITERKRIEEEREQSRRTLEKILESIPVGVAIVGRDKIVRHVNSAALDLMQCNSRDQIIGLDCHQTPCPIQGGECPVLDLGQDINNLESVVRTKNGKEIPVLKTVIPIEIGNENVLLETFVDIAERKKAEKQLEQYAIAIESQRQTLEILYEDADAANRSKSEFLANMSHEIRTPMTAILGFTDILLGTLTNQDQIDAAKIIKRNGEHLLGLINDILDLSKIEAGKLEVEHIQCSPCQLLAEVTSLMRVRATAKNLELEIEFDGPIPRSIQSDPTRLRQILINLTGNAIKFTEVGQIRLVTRMLNTECDEPKMQFEVIDSGIGMSEEKVADLFKPFQQADASTTRKFGGTGLGLTISNRLAIALGGNIAVKSAIGAGSKFTFTVPTGSLDRVDMINNSAKTYLSLDVSKKLSGSKTKLDCRVLLVEDGSDNRRLISFLLKKAGAKVRVAENGQIAYDLALAARDDGNPFDVILMDMQMPIMDGYLATRRLREAGYSWPIIALTANAMSTDRENCLAIGCDDYMTKPIDRNELISIVNKYASYGALCAVNSRSEQTSMA